MAPGIIFPTSVYGQLSDVFGTNIAAYANSQGFPPGAGLQLGMFGLLFDGTVVRLLKAALGINPYDAVYSQSNNGTDYVVQQTMAVNQRVIAANDRSGSTSLVAGNIAWFTSKGLATMNVGPSITASVMLASCGTPGYVLQFIPGNSIQSNIVLLNTSTSAGAYPVLIG